MKNSNFRARNLERALSLKASNGQGSCFHMSFALVLDMHDSELCVGTFAAATLAELMLVRNASLVPFLHAWVECRGSAFAPTLVERMDGLVPMERAEYYTTNGVTDIKKLTRRQILKINRELRFSNYLRGGPPPSSNLVEAMLNELGIRYVVSAHGGVLPAP